MMNKQEINKIGDQQESSNVLKLVPVPQMDGYFVDILGNIFSIKRTKYFKKLTQHIGYGRTKPYLRLKIDGKLYLAHRIIASIKIGRRLNNRETVNHINGKTLDNGVTNLEVVSHRENVLHAIQNGLYCSGERWYKARDIQKCRESSTTRSRIPSG